MGWFTFSVRSTVSFDPWFKKHDTNRHTITTINRMMANHTCVRTHLNRIKIVEEQLCVCEENDETIHHLLWDCKRFQNERTQLLLDLSVVGINPSTSIRDLLGCQQWKGLAVICSFFKRYKINI
jgi:hypothetical protein